MSASRVRTALAAALFAGLSILPAFAQEGTPTPTPEPLPNCPAFEGEPTDVRSGYYMGEGIAYLRANQLRQAEFSFTCVIRVIDPDYAAAYVARAEVYMQTRDFERAIRDYEAALQFNLDAISPRNNRGVANTIIGDYTTAAADFERVLSVDPNYLPAINNRSIIYALQGEYDEAISLLNGAIARSGAEGALAEARDPERNPETPVEVDPVAARLYALRGILESSRALDSFNDYLDLANAARFFPDERISAAAGSLESRATFELRLDDGTWMIRSDYTSAE